MGGYQSHEAVVRLLIERNDVDINAQDNYGRMPLSVTENGYEAVVRLLIERGGVDAGCALRQLS